MVDFVPIYQGRDFYVPAFDVKVGGVDIPRETQRDVIEVSYSDSIDQIDSFELTVNNWDAEALDFKYTGSRKGASVAARSTLFDPGQEIEIWMGYFEPIAADRERPDEPEPLRLMLVGTITSLTPNFPSSGQPTLQVRGQNVLRELISEQETHDYGPNTSASEIALRVGRRGNMRIGNLPVSVRVNEQAQAKEPVIEYMLQDNQYDILFLLQLAHRHGYDVLLKQESRNRQPTPYLYFGPSTEQPRVSYLLSWGKSLIEFQPTLTTTRQVNEVTVRGWNAIQKRAINVTVNRSQLATRPLRDRQRLRRIEDGFRERREIVVDRPFRSEQEARRYALDRLERLARDMVTGRGSTLGSPDLRAGAIIEIQDLGETFDGRYFVKSTTHRMGANGYTTELEARLEEQN